MDFSEEEIIRLLEETHQEIGLNDQGLKSSEYYRLKFFQFCTRNKFNPKAALKLVFISTIVKSKKRLLSVVESGSEIHNILSSMTQFTGGDDAVVFPVVCLPSAFPEIAALAWMKRCKVMNKPDEVLRNQVMGQLKLSSFTQNEHKKWEQELWTVKITKSTRNGQGYEKGFHEAYYQNKVEDQYEIKGHPAPATGYTESDLIEVMRSL